MSYVLDKLAVLDASNDDGYEMRSINGVIRLAADGSLVSVEAADHRGAIPRPPPRTSRVAAAFLSGNAAYWFDIPARGSGAWALRSAQCRIAMADLHRHLLANAMHPALRAVLEFLDSPPQALQSVPVGNLIVSVDDLLVHEIDEARRIWSNAQDLAPVSTNPTVSLGGAGTLRLWVQGTTGPYGATATAPPQIARAAGGLRRLLDQPGEHCAYLDKARVCVAWVDGDQNARPLQWIFPLSDSALKGFVPPAWAGDVNVAIVRAYPPTRALVEFFWSGTSMLFWARVGSIYRRLAESAEAFRPWVTSPPSWPYVVTGRRQGAIRASIIRSICLGTRFPAEVQRLLEAEAKKGNRSNAAFGLAAMVVGSQAARQ